MPIKPHVAPCSLPYHWTGERVGKVKGRKLVGKDDLIRTGKVSHASKTRKLIHHFPQQAGAQATPGKQEPATRK